MNLTREKARNEIKRWVKTERTIRCELHQLQGRVATSFTPSRSWIGSALVVFVVIFFLIAVTQPQTASYQEIVDSVFHHWVAMAICALALWVARRETFGPLPPLLRVASGVLLPIFVIVSILTLLIWPPFWAMLQPFGVIENEVRRRAITATIAVGFICCAFLMFRTFLRWIWRFSRRYEHSGFAIGLRPLYLFFRRRRAS